jgi:uncharacterized protein YegP (UPF0339 family)
MAGKFEIYKDKKGEFRYRLKAGNGEIILTGEGYKTKAGVKNGIASIQKNAAVADRFDTQTSKNGKHRFLLKAGNSQIIGQSQLYETPAACKNGAKSVAKNAPTAKIEDTTG